MERPDKTEGSPNGALAELADRCGQRCFRIAYAILRDAHAAEDACQQAFLKVLEVNGQAGGVQAPERWLIKVVTNEALQAARRRRMELRGRERCAAEGSGVSDMTWSLAAPVSKSAERRELMDAVCQAIEELPEQTQTVVVLRLMQGMTGTQVQELLACSASEVSRRLHSGMEHLRQRLIRTNMTPQEWCGDGL